MLGQISSRGPTFQAGFTEGSGLLTRRSLPTRRFATVAWAPVRTPPAGRCFEKSWEQLNRWFVLDAIGILVCFGLLDSENTAHCLLDM